MQNSFCAATNSPSYIPPEAPDEIAHECGCVVPFTIRKIKCKCCGRMACEFCSTENDGACGRCCYAEKVNSEPSLEENHVTK